MSLFSQLKGSKLTKFLTKAVGYVSKKVTPTPPKVDLTVAPKDFLPLLRPRIRQSLWLRAILKARLKMAYTLSKREKKGIRANVFHGHWLPIFRRRAAR